MPDPGCGPTLADRLRVAVARANEAERMLREQDAALIERPGFDLQARNARPGSPSSAPSPSSARWSAPSRSGRS